MLITKTSRFSGRLNTLDLPITLERIEAWRQSGALIQHAFPDLTADQREFLLSGVTAEEWDAAFPPEDDADEQAA